MTIADRSIWSPNGLQILPLFISLTAANMVRAKATRRSLSCSGVICDIVSYEKYVIGPHLVYPHNVGFPDIVHATSNPIAKVNLKSLIVNR
jgi:hypothetical protein